MRYEQHLLCSAQVRRAHLSKAAQRELINVFVATTPNPTSGFLLLVPPEEAVVLHMTVEEALKMVISGGLITPPFNPAPPVVTVPPHDAPPAP